MYLTYRNISVGEMGPEISGKQKSTPKPKRKFILGHPVFLGVKLIKIDECINKSSYYKPEYFP